MTTAASTTTIPEENWAKLRKNFATHLNVPEEQFATVPAEETVPASTADTSDGPDAGETYELSFGDRQINLEDMAVAVLSQIKNERDDKSFLESLPEGLVEALDVSLLYISINPTQKALTLILRFNQVWGIEPIFDIENPELTITYENGAYSGSVNTDVKFGVEFVMEANFPDLSFRAETIPGDYALADLLAFLSFEKTGAGPFEHIKLASAAVSLESVLQLATVHVEFDDVFHLGIFDLNSLVIGVDYGWGLASQLSATAESDIHLEIGNGFDIVLAGAYEAGTGWLFEAVAEMDVELGDILDWIEGKLGVRDFPIPHSLKDLALKSLLIHYDTMAQSFKFQICLQLSAKSEIELTLEVHDQADAGEGAHTANALSAGEKADDNEGSAAAPATTSNGAHNTDSADQSKSTKQIDINATVYLNRHDTNEIQLAGMFDKTGKTTSFMAVFHPNEPLDITLNDLLGTIGEEVEGIGDGLAVEVASVLLARISHADSANPNKDSRTRPEKTSEGASDDKKPAKTRVGSATTIMMIDIGGRIELSSLGDLPVVGTVIGDAAELDLRFQLGYATGSEDGGILGSLNGLLSDYNVQLPEAVKKGFTIQTQLRLGADSDPISVEFGEAGSEKTNPVGQDGSNNFGGTGITEPVQSAPVPAGQALAGSDDSSISWYDIHKGFGPIHVGRVGFAYADGKVSAYLDAGLNLTVLEITLMGLSASFKFPVSSFKDLDPSFSLQGIGLDFKKGNVELGGALLRGEAIVDGTTITTYDGMVILKASQISLTAVGSFAQLPHGGGPSAFIYGILNFPFGGDPAFFITGFAAGFGYNRRLIVPPVAQAADHWLVHDAVNGGDDDIDIQEKMQQVHSSVIPEAGQYFAAGGIHFTTYELLDNFILVIVSFGNHFELDILGVTTVQMPPEVKEPDMLLAEIQLAIKGRFAPDEGVVSVEGVLTNHSFLLSHANHLTGGFAVYAWFDGDHAGDFVVTLGGYNPHFKRPAHYPTVPRLGFEWKVTDNLNLKGGLYFALTPGMVMAGGGLLADYNDSFSKFKASLDIHAHFEVYVHLLMKWKPFHYDLTAGLWAHLEIAYDAWLASGHKSFDIKADLHLWGPKFAGTAKLSVHILHHDLKFDVAFGEKNPDKPKPLSWSAFRSGFLPGDSWLSEAIVHGLEHKENDQHHVSAKHLELRFDSIIPITAIDVSDGLSLVEQAGGHHDNPGIWPMQVAGFDAPLELALTKKPVDAGDFSFGIEPIIKNMPKALWATSDPGLSGTTMPVIGGVWIRPILHDEHNGASANIPHAAFDFDTRLIAVPNDVNTERDDIRWVKSDEETTTNMLKAQADRERLIGAFGFKSYKEIIPHALSDSTH